MNDDKPFWRSLAEYENPAGPSETPEFEAPLDPPTSTERRRFLQLTGASMALASASACRFKEDKLLPFVQQPEGVVPGVPRYFMTAMDFKGAGVGLKVKSFDGRPIKIDGNPAHPDSFGATTAQHQATLLDLYDPDRSQAFAKGDGKGSLTDVSETDFRVFALEHFKALRSAQGRGLAVLVGESSSQSVADMRARWQARYPQGQWYEYEPAATDNERIGSNLAFGSAYRTHLKLEAAKVIVSLDADLLGARSDSLALARAWASRRDPRSEMNRMYVFESSLSETGSGADHRFAVRSEHIKAIAAYLDAELSQRLGASGVAGAAQPKPAAKVLDEPALQKILAAAVSDLAANRGASVVAVGATQPPEVHALAHRINALLGNVGSTVEYSSVQGARDVSSADNLTNLLIEMNAGRVDTLLVLDSNPVYTAPGDADFVAALGKVKTKVHVGLYRDETALASDWHVPQAHFLEAWGDTRASDGTASVQQPVIAPLYGGKSVIEVLGILSGDPIGGLEIVQRSLGELTRDPRLWRKALHDGVVPNRAWPLTRPPLRGIGSLTFTPGELSGLEVEPEQLELVLAPDPKLHDGRFANNGWLQELPDSNTKLTWDNALLLSPKTAKTLNVTDNMLVTLSVDGRSLTVPAMLTPGQATGSVKLYLGYGRTAAGRIGGIKVNGLLGTGEVIDPIGVNAYPLRSKRLWSFGRGASVKPSSDKYKLATTQDKHTMDRIGKFGIEERLPMLIRQANLEKFKEEPDFAKHAVHHPPLLSLWKDPVTYSSPKWSMSIDLNKCTGCSGCVVACQAENNIPVVGKTRVSMGREMHWLRIDRYFHGDPEQPETAHQPIPCMHCEHAPCEQVCPVGATTHSHDGLNEMTYNRCIGTRYCSNNCPYKVRKFNYFNFHEELKDERNQVKEMAFNPDVTVRFRGVMEKCTYCVQRVREATAKASRENRPVGPDEVTTACQDSCPTQAIIFGDAANEKSQVAERKRDTRDYSLLEELNVRPRTTYMARVRNPHPELG
ncbi:MAG TPA: Fe-S-cluster-containing hydrogenase [Polyangiaceae bacterium]|nr:Fe-S-cluster-containing hydrogenase [Polyangiaceae bacterium]